MLDCIRQGIERNAALIFIAAAIMAVIAAAAAIGGGLVIALGPISLGVIGSPIFAALLVFGAVVALAVAAIALNCLIGAQPPSVDEVPPEEDGIQPEDLVQPGTDSAPLTEDPDGGDTTGTGGPSKPKPKKPKGPKRGTPANPVGGYGQKKPA